ncbi:MAG TPA: AEC family transporter [Devosiaceae bacterium]|nr:AEC family transporter [Devosiaceae bacterium]
MLASLLIILPIFAIIAAGYFCGRKGLLGPTASSELNRFVVYLALPALLFDVLAESNWASFWQPSFIASFTIGSFVVYGGTLLCRVRQGHKLSDASIDGLNAGYANTGYIGFPLCELIFGRQSFALVTIAAILTVTLLFAVAIVFVEIGVQTERRPGALALKVGKSLLRNPLVIAPALGALWAALGVPLPDAAKNLLHLMSGAASPCALVSLGLFLAARHKGSKSGRPAAMMLTALKLFAQPAITAICAYFVFRMAAFPSAVAVVLAALPTGTGPFMIAEFYKREAVVTSGTILFSTVASVVTLSVCVLLLGHVAPPA